MKKSLKQNRDTTKATHAAAKAAELKRNEVIEQIRTKIFSNWCTCGNCREGYYKQLCMSFREIARTANTLDIKTPSGKSGTWQPAAVSSLFKRYNQNPAKQSNSLVDFFD